MCIKALSGKGVHTFVGMVGYCTKDRDMPHFKVLQQLACLHACSPALLPTCLPASVPACRLACLPACQLAS